MSQERFGILIQAEAGTGVLHQLTGVIASHDGDISSVAIVEQSKTDTKIDFEIVTPGDIDKLESDLNALPVVKSVLLMETLFTRSVPSGSRTGKKPAC